MKIRLQLSISCSKESHQHTLPSQETPPTLLWKFSLVCVGVGAAHSSLIWSGGEMVVERKTLSSGRREKSEKSGIKSPYGERKRNEDIFHEVFKKEKKEMWKGKKEKWMLSGRRWLNGAEWSPSTWNIFCLLIHGFLFCEDERKLNKTFQRPLSNFEKNNIFFSMQISFLSFAIFPRTLHFGIVERHHFVVVDIVVCLKMENKKKRMLFMKNSAENQLLRDTSSNIYSVFCIMKIFSSIHARFTFTFATSLNFLYERSRKMWEENLRWKSARASCRFYGSPENLI